MGDSIISKIRTAAREHPLVICAAWIALAAILLTAPLVAMFILQLLTRSFPAKQTYLLFISAVLIPLLITMPIGALIGSRILTLPPGMTSRATLYGSLTSLTVFIIWTLILEPIPTLPGIAPSGNSNGDLPGAAIVVAYLVVLPVIVLTVIGMGALAGSSLYLTFAEF